MAGTSTRQYNLCSGKQEGLQIPVQIQLAKDTEFLKTLLNHQNGQVSDSESSNSEAYCEALINDSVVDSFSNASKTSSPKGKKSCSDPKKSDDMQQIINTKIRQYLNRMLLAKECQKSEEQTQGCLTPDHTGPQSPSPSDSRFEYFAYRFICASSG